MWTEEYLDGLLTTPSEKLVADMPKIKGDIIIIGAGGKMGPTLSVLVKNACREAGIDKKVIAVSRFGDPFVTELLKKNEVGMISADLMEPGAVNSLPEVENVIYMAGRKFGTDGQESLTWAMNAWLPSLVSEKFKRSNTVVFSSGNVYPMMSLRDGGADEATPPEPIGEYAMSCLGRERVFEYASNTYGARVCIYRLTYAVDLRYGVLNDIAQSILSGRPVSVATPVFNCIWQGSANEIAVRCLLICESPVNRLNVTGPETVSVKWAARELGKHLGKDPVFEAGLGKTESDAALISNASKMAGLFGNPSVPINTLIRWQAEWLMDGGRSLNKPTHFEEREGKF